MNNYYMTVPLSSVELTDRYCDEAFNIEVNNMLLLNPDRLLAGFWEVAGRIAGLDEASINTLMKGEKRYGGNWEDGLIGGHTLGHYITALAQAFASPALDDEKRKKVSERLDYILDALKECQKLVKGTGEEGFIFGAALPTKEFRDNPVLQFDNVEQGFDHPFEKAWVPWYTTHKILSGLNASFKIAGKNIGLEVANDFGMWIARRALSWSEEINRTVLGIEYGGMNDCLYELYQINEDLKKKGSSLYHCDFEMFKAAAHRFDEIPLFEKVLLSGKNTLNNFHANTTIPKFVGALARYETDAGETKYLEYAESFFDMVVSKHTYVTGGNSEDEHFGEDDILDGERTNVNNETCNTYNMLKFSRRLFAETGKKKYLDYAERTFINAILASQNHETGFTTYFQPMATGYQKVFNTLDGNFWCCTGTGYENFTKLQDGIYFENEKELIIALYISSEYKTEDYDIAVSCDFSSSPDVRINVAPREGKKITKDLCLSIPTWVKDAPEVKKQGEILKIEERGGFLIIPANMLEDGCELSVSLPMGITCHNLQDGKDTYAFMYGPYVLSARLGVAKMKTRGHGISVVVADRKAVDTDEVVITSEKSVDDFIMNIESYLVKRDGEMEFDLKGTDRELVFTTHYNQYRESYGIYWKFKTV
ncbi:beta-L-arabinofuranosidase domain-containing protein [Butyrivibrio sp. AE3004]|uniref:beta-L-arabinofuranosidase domain-containing protein n=1 Tax=Butyrivibrio sp. AE3004 TaxID=1506994 RepID=UPI0018CC171E|nr:beta-L-arabinofuranosidase domain-containing protein [Butyrivibrio sp. AE3004]